MKKSGESRRKRAGITSVFTESAEAADKSEKKRFRAPRDGAFVESVLAGYNLSHGGLMPVGLAIFAVTPWMAWRLRRVSANH